MFLFEGANVHRAKLINKSDKTQTFSRQHWDRLIAFDEIAHRGFQ